MTKKERPEGRDPLAAGKEGRRQGEKAGGIAGRRKLCLSPITK